MMPELHIFRRTGEHAGTILVDDEDFEWVSKIKWSLSAQGYAVRKKGGRKGKVVSLHRELLGLEPGAGGITDHINGDRLDNRRENLRVVDYVINGQNTPSRGGTSKYRGVDWNGKKWRAQATLAGRNRYLGAYESEDEAARVAHEFRVANMPGYVER